MNELSYRFDKLVKTSDVSDYSLPFRLNNFGMCRNIRSGHRVFRPKGRNDYQLLYLKCEMELTAGGKSRRLPPQTAVLFRPGEPQLYDLSCADRLTYFWIHFTGGAVAELLDRLGLSDTAYDVGGSLMIERCFNEIYENCLLDKAYRDVDILSYLTLILTDIARLRDRSGRGRFEAVIRSMNEAPLSGLSNADYAELCGMSESGFIRGFKSAYGATPHMYVMKRRLELCCGLLQYGEPQVKEAAVAAGFTDIQYFHRFFKKQTGCTPLEYSRKYRADGS